MKITKFVDKEVDGVVVQGICLEQCPFTADKETKAAIREDILAEYDGCFSRRGGSDIFYYGYNLGKRNE